MSLGDSIFKQTSEYVRNADVPQSWAKGYTNVISCIACSGFTKIGLKNLRNGNPDGTYWVLDSVLREVLRAENMKDKRAPFSIFYEHDEL